MRNIWQGFADCRPSESIQAHELPGLAVSVVFCTGGLESLNLKQYKDYPIRKKAKAIDRLFMWLSARKTNGDRLVGAVNVHQQITAATLGMEMIEEIEGATVEKAYDSYKLKYDLGRIDLAHAVALQYYLFTISFGLLRAETVSQGIFDLILVCMDRFPGCSTNGTRPGEPLPPTDGIKFIRYVRNKTETGIYIQNADLETGCRTELTSLDWYRPSPSLDWKEGKKHPGFILPDWLCAAAVAHHYPEQTCQWINHRSAEAICGKLSALYDLFKSFDFYSFDEESLYHIRSGTKKWSFPDEARTYVLSRIAPN
ncbi:MAG: hypothetical protein ACFB12_26550 [Leptolyngbyaceae cyanobacterium]